MDNIRILLADDDDLIREGLIALLTSDPRFEVVGEAGEGVQAVEAARKLRPNIVLMDLAMPGMDGVQAIREIKAMGGISVLALTAHKKERYVRAAVDAGADGYLLKSANIRELVQAIETVLKGNPCFCPDVQSLLLNFARQGRACASGASENELSAREREVLLLVARGLSNARIAEELFISIKTVEKHKNSIRHKLGIRSTAELTAYCLERGMLD